MYVLIKEKRGNEIQKGHGWVNYLGYDTGLCVHAGDILKILII